VLDVAEKLPRLQARRYAEGRQSVGAVRKAGAPGVRPVRGR
jgi:hypothetical protein